MFEKQEKRWGVKNEGKLEKMTGSRMMVVEGLYVHLSCTIAKFKKEIHVKKETAKADTTKYMVRDVV
jgi:hypothetical protein